MSRADLHALASTFTIGTLLLITGAIGHLARTVSRFR